jgi:hypothetical protein
MHAQLLAWRMILYPPRYSPFVKSETVFLLAILFLSNIGRLKCKSKCNWSYSRRDYLYFNINIQKCILVYATSTAMVVIIFIVFTPKLECYHHQALGWMVTIFKERTNHISLKHSRLAQGCCPGKTIKCKVSCLRIPDPPNKSRRLGYSRS